MGILNKKHYEVPNTKSYNEHTTLVAIGWGIFVCIMIFLFLTGCSTSTKVRKAYEKAAAYSPITAKDSLNAIIVGKKVIKQLPPKVVAGKTVIRKIPYEKLVKVVDNDLISRITDSIVAENIKQASDYNDNISEVIKDCNKAVKQAVRKGYLQAIDSIGKIQLPDDTLLVDNDAALELTDCQVRQRTAEGETIKAVAQMQVYKSQSRDRGWLILFLFAGLVLFAFLGIKKTIKTSVSK